MSGSIEPISGTPECLQECAEFLARFVADGEIRRPKKQDMLVETWRERLHWWWGENPFRKEDSPLGFLMRNDESVIVGMNGLIPRDYRYGDQLIPGLISTTFFVRTEHRAEALPLFMKIHRLAREYHMVDSTPGPEMQKILSRFRYRHEKEAQEIYMPFRFRSLLPTTWAMAFCRLFVPSLQEAMSSGRLIQDSEKVQTIPQFTPSKIRPDLTREGIQWLCRSGVAPPIWIGQVDDLGNLLAYAFVRRMKLRWWMPTYHRVVEWGDVDPESRNLKNIVSRLVNYPAEFGISPHSHALAFADIGGEAPNWLAGFPRHRLSSKFHYAVSGRIEDPETQMVCYPQDGDRTLL